MKRMQKLLGVTAMLLMLTAPSFAAPGIIYGNAAKAGVLMGDKAGIIVSAPQQTSFFQSLLAMFGIIIGG